ncbi:MAG: DUF4350 domain-containing protein, partial [Candidatus Omnitrophica bacterium]|nr:DUF4350 domain-containing protein [Candidatus Omnitrophota bacterium]
MKGLNLHRTDLVLLGMLIAFTILVAILASWVMPPEKKGSFFQQPSSYFNRAYGTKALFLTLQELGQPIQRLERSIDSHSLQDIDGLLILEPWSALSEDEQGNLRDWVMEGNCLVYIPSLEETFMEEEDDDDGADRSEEQSESEFQTVRIEKATSENHPLFNNVANLEFSKGALKSLADETPPCENWLLEEAKCETLISDATLTLGVHAQLGEGSVYWIADSHPLSNKGLLKDSHAVFAANLVHELTQDSPDFVLAFDEYHHGFVDRDTSPVAILKLTFGDWWGYGIANALLVGALALWVASRRFGRPRELRGEQRRHQSEFIYAAGNLLRRGKGLFPVRETLASYYRERLCSHLHLPPNIQEGVLI